MAFKYYLLTTLIVISDCLQLEANTCDFVREKRTYFCNGITDKFPSMYYGSYHLKCTDCHIPVFNAATFPVHSELISFNASNSGIQNITTGAFADLPTLQYLYLYNNRIFGLSKNAFINLRQLYELDLSYNELGDLTPGFLSGVESVSITFNHNHIKEIPPNVFEGVLGIMSLNLSNNKIAILHFDSFKGPENIEILDLQHNNICYVPLGLFSHLPKVKDLNLSFNKLTSFVTGTFSGLEDLLTLNLAKNDFSEFDASALLPLSKISNLDISRNGLFYLDAHDVHLNAPTIRKLKFDDNLWSCALLTNMVRFFKSVNVDTSEKTNGRYEITNVNGVGCSLEPLNQKVSFEQFLRTATYHTNVTTRYC